MKSKGWIIVGILFVIIGAVIGLIALAKLDFKFDKFYQNDVHIEEQYDQNESIYIKVASENVYIERTNESQIKLQYTTNEYINYMVSNENGLRIEQKISKRPWYLYVFSWGFINRDLRVFVPETFQGKIQIDSTVSNIKISDQRLSELKIESTTGNIQVTNVTAPLFGINATTGNVKIQNIVATDFKVATTTGNITLKQITTDIAWIDVTVGNLRFETLTATNITIGATTGNVSGNIIGSQADYTIHVNKTIGNSNIASGGNGPKSLKISTTVGNIHISFQ